MKILMTGASGFVGKKVLKVLLKERLKEYEPNVIVDELSEISYIKNIRGEKKGL